MLVWQNSYQQPPSVQYCYRYFVYHHQGPRRIFSLSLHDALPILSALMRDAGTFCLITHFGIVIRRWRDRKSTRLNSSHANISYAVLCLKKQNLEIAQETTRRTA